jgi:hypothetical protein
MGGKGADFLFLLDVVVPWRKVRQIRHISRELSCAISGASHLSKSCANCGKSGK